MRITRQIPYEIVIGVMTNYLVPNNSDVVERVVSTHRSRELLIYFSLYTYGNIVCEEFQSIGNLLKIYSPSRNAGKRFSSKMF